MKKSLLLFTAILTVLLLASPVYAADITLTSRCALADAIIAANNDRPEGGCPAGRGADTITLTRDITLDGGLPKITSAITIEGGGYTISGDNRWRIFYNDGGALAINNLAMTKGHVEGDAIPYYADGNFANTTANPIGGAIVNWLGTVTISDSTFSGNSAEDGGAIFNWGRMLAITNSAFRGNSADSFGGAIANFGELSIVSSTFSGNSAEDGGGAITNLGKLSVSDSTFSDNSAGVGGGAIDNREGTLGISSSTFSDNSAGVGGAISNGEGTLSIVNSSFSDNSAELGGGAIYNGGELSISDSVFSNNSAELGGGAIYNGGELSISDSSFSGNSAGELGGAIINGGELSIVNSTFSGNSAELGGAVANFGEGELSMINSIIAGRGKDACYSESRLKRNISNFIQDGSCSPAFEGDPKLGRLVVPKDGSPAYFPLLAGSRAIDAADDDYCPAADQIGTVRPQGAGCDIGAIEYVSP